MLILFVEVVNLASIKVLKKGGLDMKKYVYFVSYVVQIGEQNPFQAIIHHMFLDGIYSLKHEIGSINDDDLQNLTEFIRNKQLASNKDAVAMFGKKNFKLLHVAIINFKLLRIEDE